MKSALQEIGLAKAARFGFLTLAMVPYRMALFPQLRSLWLRLLGARVGRGAIVHDVRFFNLYRRGLPGLVIGERAFLGDELMMDLAEAITIGPSATIGERSVILTHLNVGYDDHPLQSYFPPVAAPVTVGTGAFVAASVTLLPGVTIGEGAFVAAGSVVTKDVPPWTLVAGVPARTVRALK